MAKFRLQALTPGRKLVPTEDGGRAWIDFSPEYVAATIDRTNKMLRAGIPVPVSWGHRSDAKPGSISADDWQSAKEKGVAGYALSCDIKGGPGFADIEIPDDADGRQAEKVRFCSPEIDDFTDGNGKHWGEVFTHIALTPRPVQHDQPPIARLSLSGPIRLSVDPLTGKNMADEKPDEKPEDVKPPADEKPKEKPDESRLGSLIAALRDAGFEVPAEVTDIDGLIIAVKSKAPTSEPEEEEELEDDDMNNDELGEVRSPPVQMSMAEKKSHERAVNLTRRDLTERIQTLVKRRQITPAIGSKLTQQIPKIQLSFSEAGDLKPNALLHKIEAYEELPKGGAFQTKGKRVDMSHDAREVETPGYVTDEGQPDDSPQARKKRQDDYDKMVNPGRI
jgi:hypothetical protein